MGKFKNWKDVKKELNFTPEEEAEMQLEMELIEATIEARKKSNLTQRDLSEKSGIIEDKEKEYILNVFKFNDKQAQKIMTKKNKVISIDIKDNKKEILDKIKNSRFTRFPVLDNDKILGFLNVKDLIYMHQLRKKFNIKELIHEVLCFEKEEMIDDIFRTMQKHHETFSIITKNNKLVGILTMEDAIEEIVGNIFDEYN